MSRFRTIATAAALAGTAVLAVVATSAAQASGTTASDAKAETRWCTGSDLAISAVDMRSQSAGVKAHRIRFVSAEGASCKIGGSLSNVRFLDAQGKNMNVPLAGGQGEYSEALVDAEREAAVYVGSQSEGPRVTPAYIRFNLPGQGKLGDLVTVAWPSGLGAIVKVGNIMAPVS